MGVFYLFYYLFLNRLTFFTINRWYLIATLFLSMVIPLLPIPVSRQQLYPTMVQQVVNVNNQQSQLVQVAAVLQPQPIGNPVNWMLLLKWAYLFAVAGLFVHLLVTLYIFFTRIKNRRIDRIGSVNILRGDKNLPNGSFLNYIFLNDNELSADEIQQILAHEMLHVTLLHSADRIIVKMIQIAFWFNPFVYLYARSIEENHEFEVDREIARSSDKNQYANLLLHLSVSGQGMLYHSFSKVPLKKRISMLFNKPSVNMKKIIYVLAVPVILISCLAFGRFQNDKAPQQYSAINGVEAMGKNPLVRVNDKVYSKDILYKISPDCITATEIFNPNPKLVKYGVTITDGYIGIWTKGGKIMYLTALDKANLVKRKSVPQSVFYTRLHLKNNDGSAYDEAIVHLQPEGEASTSLKPADKVGFLIDDTFYDEEGIKKITPEVVNSLSGAYGVGGPEADMPAIAKTGYRSIFSFKTKAAEKADTVKKVRVNGKIYSGSNTQDSAHIKKLLKQLTGYQVDADGNVTQNGAPVTKVLINGQTIGSGEQSPQQNDVIKKLPGAQLDSKGNSIANVQGMPHQTIIGYKIDSTGNFSKGPQAIKNVRINGKSFGQGQSFKADKIVIVSDYGDKARASVKPTPSKADSLLKRMQGYEVDQAGNITVNGQPVKKIKIDGKVINVAPKATVDSTVRQKP